MKWAWRSPSWLAIGLIRLYQRTLSPLLGPCCRYYPSCSRYAVTCLERHGLMRGGWYAARRIARCTPWHPGGVDLPPPARGALTAAGVDPSEVQDIPAGGLELPSSR